MTMVGFDIAKNTVAVAVVDQSGEILDENVVLANTDEELTAWLSQQLRSHPDLQVVCESTSYYHYALLRVTAALGIPSQLLNPILTKQATKSTIRGKKTDRGDAILIARLGLRGAGRLVAKEPANAKTLLRSSLNLRLMETQLRLLQASLKERRIQPPAKADKALTACRQLLLSAVEQYRSSAAKELDEQLLKRLCTIPGIGVYTASVVISEIGDLSRFSTSTQLVGFSGFDPRVRQSGTSLNRNTKLTKRGSPHLRRALFIAANSARRYDPQLRDYYQRKRAEGRTYTEALMPVCRKLLARIYAVWKREKDYVVKESTKP